jgi:Sulfotransferase domain
MSLEVIGTGFGRTGTLSLKLSLEQLGFGPCYHMIEMRTHQEHDDMWRAHALGEQIDWRDMLAGYRSTVDWPAISVWKELIAANPDAKVILTVRDAESWYESASKTIFARMLEYEGDGVRDADPARRNHMSMVNAVVLNGTFGGDMSRDNAIQVYNAHNDEVRRVVPPEKLLVYEASQGWEPLCAFLTVPVPDTPYPNVNSTADFTQRFPDRT